MQSGSDHCGVAGIDHALQKQVTADALVHFVERFGHHLDAGIAGKMDHPVAQVVAKNQHEECENDHDSGAANWAEEARRRGQ